VNKSAQSGGSLVKRLYSVENIGLYIVFLAIIIFFSAASPYFFTLRNFMDILRQSTFVLVAALGMTLVIITAGIDLSVGSVIGLSAGVTSVILLQGAPTALAVAAGLVTGAVCGLINGFIITRFGVTDLITTLGVPFQAFARRDFSQLGRGNIGPVPVPILIAAVIFIILRRLLGRPVLGRHIFAVGSNSTASLLSGINVSRIKLIVYMISGLTAAASGIMLASRLSSVPPDLGQGYEMSVIAAVVIGGTSLFGGSGSVLGTVIGSLMVAIIGNGLILLNVNPFYQYVINGVIIILAVSFNNARRKHA